MALGFLLLSCERSSLEESWVFYTIPEGNHSSLENQVSFHHKNQVKFDVFFSLNCLYQISGEDGSDLNKLYGLSDGMNHMQNSARFAWRCLNGRTIELWYFVHSDGSQVYEKMGEVLPGEIHHLEIDIQEKSYRFRMDERQVEVNRTKSTSMGYRCYPYFGGNLTAPHEMTIAIWEYPD
jgi:hypothetical protein